MKIPSLALSLSLLLISGAALADDDCNDPISNWQPREALRQQLEDNGWIVYRIKIDDGCYEVKAQDNEGNRVEASFAPASLELMEWEREDDDGYDDDDDNNRQYQPAVNRQPTDAGQPSAPTNGIVNNRPTVTVE
ncbi:PepSY domain-containing protein [Saccharospirillum alexandrii]|uniref:PepSY domain-containing protein n=1 Tax=Saccharospirillum alexandrii TaxID=2448477 RepID=UPI000FD89A1E|nr:PepSY domain-containing protein [Saccharospirillum alexandrii]